MKVYDENNIEVKDYVGTWYSIQSAPQDIYLEIDSKEDPKIDVNGKIGNDVPAYVWHNRAIRIDMPSDCYSVEHINSILEDLKEDIEKIEESYSEEYQNGNIVGSWNDDLIEALRDKIESSEFYSSDLWFDRDGTMEDEEVEDE